MKNNAELIEQYEDAIKFHKNRIRELTQVLRSYEAGIEYYEKRIEYLRRIDQHDKN